MARQCAPVVPCHRVGGDLERWRMARLQRTSGWRRGRGSAPPAAAPEPGGAQQVTALLPEGSFDLDAVTQHLLVTALAKTRGHKGQAADLLGVHPRTLTRMMRRFGHPRGLSSASSCHASQGRRRPPHAASRALRQRRRSVLVIIPTRVVPSTTGRQPMPLVMIISAAAATEVSGEMVTTG